ncbi:MAG: hypothetical protein PVJ67_02155 [Candidatus Pacearchaeota archaeon]|jgi:hypothetical protein
MAKRNYIVANQLRKYPVSNDVDELLDTLSFKKFSSSQVPDWELFTRTDRDNFDFAAIYGDKEFFVHGDFSSIETPQRDLENISRIFNENWASRKIRGRTIAPIFAPLLGGLGVVSYDVYNENIDILGGITDFLGNIFPSISRDEAGLSAGLGILGLALLGEIGGLVANNLLNRHYGSRLSKEAEEYNYGGDGENRLRTELVFNKIKSGEMNSLDFLKLQGYKL